MKQKRVGPTVNGKTRDGPIQKHVIYFFFSFAFAASAIYLYEYVKVIYIYTTNSVSTPFITLFYRVCETSAAELR